MGKFIAPVVETKTIFLSEQTDGFWLWDTTREMNLSVKAKSVNDAFVEALMYYQKRLMYVEKAHDNLSKKVDTFISQFEETI